MASSFGAGAFAEEPFAESYTRESFAVASSVTASAEPSAGSVVPAGGVVVDGVVVLEGVVFMRRTPGGPDESPLNAGAVRGPDGAQRPVRARHSGARTDQISESWRTPRWR